MELSGKLGFLILYEMVVTFFFNESKLGVK